MFEDKTYKRCSCKGPLADEDGKPVLDSDGNQKIGYLEKNCPKLSRRDHGSWYYSIELPPGPDGKRLPRAKKGGFRTKKDAATEAEKVWKLAEGGVDVLSAETFGEYLRRWFAKRVDLKKSTRKGYEDYIERVFIPGLGAIKLLNLRTRHIQAMFEQLWADNEVHAQNHLKAHQALAAERAAHTAWKDCEERPRPMHLRQGWEDAKAALKEARAQPWHVTGPGTQVKMLNTLSGALEDAVKEKLISENWTKHVVLPKYVRPKPLVWTPARMEAWRQSGEKPGKVMVWMPEQTGEFLDAVAEHRLYPMFHLMVFRGLRRGEAVGLPWAETDLTLGTVHISEQLVASSYDVWEDTPKSESGERTIKLDSETRSLLDLWRERQDRERADWEANTKAWKRTGLVFTWEDGGAYHPEYLSQAFMRLVKRLGLPPVRLHDLRHCAATLSLAAGLHMKAIQTLLGHSSYSLTADTYTSVLPQFEEAQAEAPLALVPRKSPAQRDVVQEPETKPDVPTEDDGDVPTEDAA
ncbi:MULTISPECIES: tyrosine-type recombinase/integrase [unclassified Streptomyces]|uniref:tyrosine-type recombinase/integrase n=1 Tax=unclassified Streptomyces TaxID=2593676 RepID=UPI0029A8A4BF|nr:MULTISPECIES: tyrosine-type recombinase/integrase [unclassified Streptomyces]MDX3766343.1 tyrosine-type recombinase/integrase [Streptomyces sp. AK08-01B]MDX3816401.1 tyrosine-type recombinase/integrase [Streptomyces sp. AK08-01A]